MSSLSNYLGKLGNLNPEDTGGGNGGGGGSSGGGGQGIECLNGRLVIRGGRLICEEDNTMINNTGNCNCLIGTPYWDNGVCKCRPPSDFPGGGIYGIDITDTGAVKNPNQVIRYKAELPPIIPSIGNGGGSALDNLIQQAKDNPLLVLGLAIGIYLVVKK